MGSTIVIKDVEDDAYRSLKGEAMRSGMKVGEAASQSFRSWVQQRRLRRVRDTDRQRRAAEIMDRNRSRTAPRSDWSSVDVIRAWREARGPS
jgi:hypothetical protein